MNSACFWLILGLLGLNLASPVLGQETESTDASDTPGPTVVATPTDATPSPSAPVAPTSYQFQSDTVWAHLNISVKNHDQSFETKIDSNNLMSGWILKNEKDGQLVSKGGIKPAQSLDFTVPAPFQGSYLLTVLISADGEEVPAAVHLSAGSNSDSSATTVSDQETFQEDPDHPFNKMVEVLYDRAVEDYDKGQTDDALSLLKKAQELDPIQPQVQTLLEKVRSSVAYPNPSSNLSQSSVSTDIADDFKADSDVSVKGKGASTTDVSDDSSKSSKKSSKTGKSKSSKSKKEKKEDKKSSKKSKKTAPEDSGDTKAEADQAYNLGLASYAQGNYADAEKFWQQTLEIDPNHMQAKRNLTRLKAEHPDLP